MFCIYARVWVCTYKLKFHRQLCFLKYSSQSKRAVNTGHAFIVKREGIREAEVAREGAKPSFSSLSPFVIIFIGPVVILTEFPL